MSVAERLLTCLAAGGCHASRWFVHEFIVAAIRPAADSTCARICSLVGCVVILAGLRAELREGLLPNTSAACIQLGVAGITAILLGNVARELAFDVSARLTLWSGRAFIRTGLTVGGRAFWEIQFRNGTWMRSENGAALAFCEWTEPDGRCHRLEVLARNARRSRGMPPAASA